MKAIWNNQVIAESEKTIQIEGNHYFPTDTINKEFLTPSETQTTCHWKGEASYYNISVDGRINKDAAWFYPDPKSQASGIKNHVAFWRGVKVEK